MSRWGEGCWGRVQTHLRSGEAGGRSSLAAGAVAASWLAIRRSLLADDTGIVAAVR